MKYIIDLILDKLKGGIDRNDIAYYYFGEPELLPREVVSRGFCCVKPVNDQTSLVETQRDQGLFTIEVVVGKLVSSEWNKLPDEFGTTSWLVDVVEGTNSDGSLKQDTIKYVLRDNLTDIGKTHDLTIDYDNKQRGEDYTSEARLRLELLTLRLLNA